MEKVKDSKAGAVKDAKKEKKEKEPEKETKTKEKAKEKAPNGSFVKTCALC